MPSSRASKWFSDITSACQRIEQWLLEAGNPDVLMANDMARSAVERQLLIISEAAIRLWKADADMTRKIAPEVDWAGVRGMGNVIRHRYDDMDYEIVVDVLRSKLTPLRLACEKALEQLG